MHLYWKTGVLMGGEGVMPVHTQTHTQTQTQTHILGRIVGVDTLETNAHEMSQNGCKKRAGGYSRRRTFLKTD